MHGSTERPTPVVGSAHTLRSNATSTAGFNCPRATIQEVMRWRPPPMDTRTQRCEHRRCMQSRINPTRHSTDASRPRISFPSNSQARSINLHQTDRRASSPHNEQRPHHHNARGMSQPQAPDPGAAPPGQPPPPQLRRRSTAAPPPSPSLLSFCWPACDDGNGARAAAAAVAGPPTRRFRVRSELYSAPNPNAVTNTDI